MDQPRQDILFRPIQPEDDEFLYQVYASTRQEELAATGWDEAQKEAFLRHQHHAQHTYYQQQFPAASFDIIMVDNQPAGRLYVDRRDNEICIIDIALLTKYRRRGIGAALLGDILVEAGDAGLPVRIHVERANSALHLYYRLGFKEVEDQGVYLLLAWQPTTRKKACHE